MEQFRPVIKSFGVSSGGEPVSSVVLDNGIISCEVLSFGATIRSLLVPDGAGGRRDIVLGYDTLREYETHDGYLGATVGRFANRIAKRRFTLNGTTYTLAANDGENHLHGGVRGFSHRIWTIARVEPDKVTLSLLSEDEDEGYPGNLVVHVTYALIGSALVIHHEAVSDSDTICSLTNHSYFNLSGHSSGIVSDQEVMVNAERYTPNTADSIPLGTLCNVEGTPMDLRVYTPIAAHLDDEFEQIKQARGYDHNYEIVGNCGELRHAASARSKVSGISMQVDTTLPGIQLYTANFLSKRKGKHNGLYDRNHAFCLETQFYPDSPNQSAFLSPLLRSGEIYSHTTMFSFSVTP